MKILVKIKELLSLSSRENDTIVIYSKNLKVVYKHNGTGVSVDYYDRGKKNEPFREDQVWFNN